MNRRLLVVLTFVSVLLSACQGLLAPSPTTTPEVFIPLNKAIPDFGITLQGVHLDIVRTTLSGEFPAGCTGAAPGCTQAQQGKRILSVTLAPRDLPQGNMLAYKQLPDVSVALEGAANVPVTLTQYNNANQNLTLGFEVPADAKVFGLHWAELVEIPLTVQE